MTLDELSNAPAFKAQEEQETEVLRGSCAPPESNKARWAPVVRRRSRVRPAGIEPAACGLKGRVPDDHYDQRGATVRAAAIVADYAADADNLERADRERRSRGVTFREVAAGYLR